MDPVTFRCSCCGRVITGLPDLAYDAPLHYHQLSEAERRKRAKLSSDLCNIATPDGEEHFVRGVCLLPVADSDESFGFGVWVSLSPENFRRYSETFEDDDQSKLGAMFGWLCNRLPSYPETVKLQTTVVPQDGGARPQVWINQAHEEHPLYREQRGGISKKRLGKIYGQEICDRRKPGR